MHLVDLHSTVVLLKGVETLKAIFDEVDLHSTVVLLKAHLLEHGHAKRGGFTFYCSSIKRITCYNIFKQV